MEITVAAIVASPLLGRVRIGKVHRDAKSVSESIVVGELDAVTGRHWSGRMRRHHDKHSLLRIQDGLRDDRGDHPPDQVPRLTFHPGVQAASGPEDTVGFPVPKLFQVCDLGGTVMGRYTPLDPLRIYSLSSLSFSALALPTGQILPKLTV